MKSLEWRVTEASAKIRTPVWTLSTREQGFDSAGVTHPLKSEHRDAFRRWLEAGHHGEMEYLERESAVCRREDLERTLEGVRFLVVVTHEYVQEDAPGVPDDPSVGVVARYARGRDCHRIVKKKLLRLVVAAGPLDWCGVLH